MLRLLARFFGFLLLAGGFSALIIDGTRSIAAGEVMQARLGQTVHWLAPAKFDLIGPAVQRIHPLLWDPLLVGLFRAPTWAILGLGGLVLLYAGRTRAPRVGYSSR